MSFKLVKKVIHTDRVDGMHKLVLVILADYVNEAKGNASWPSVTTVALQAGASIRHTRRIIRELESQGVLRTIRQAGLRGTNKYVIDVDSPVENDSRADTHVRGGADTHVLPEADIYDTKGGQIRHQRADTHVPRIDKEQIRTNKLGVAPASGQGADASQHITASNTSGNVAQPDGRDAPECTEHTTHVDIQCNTCYAWQQQQWTKEPYQ